ncbi:MAG: hypothetical protein HQL23_03130 [Candidatus Omnitrophica bacterium]|nr:hypothetical protein [Candidatus Omnitrophota bacterium]
MVTMDAAAIVTATFNDVVAPTGTMVINNDAKYSTSISVTLNLTAQDNPGGSGIDKVSFSKYYGFALPGSATSLNNYTYDIFVRYNYGKKFSDTAVKFLDHDQAFYVYGNNLVYPIQIGVTAGLVDLNGYGLPDLVYGKFSGWESWGGAGHAIYDWVARLNTGNGFSSEEKIWLSADKAYLEYSITGVGSYFEPISINQNAMLVDMNGDGLVDLVYVVFPTRR